MSKFTISVETDNAAFSDDWRNAIGNILHHSYKHLFNHGEAGRARGVRSHNLRDLNGNTVGTIEIRED